MKDALQIFTAGLGGVFIGMTLLYIAIRLTSLVADTLSKGAPHGK
jgi:Na+-transporting methylmalonyl-CoA/oxaloacetate decarboxylase gamma subunit